MIFTDGSCLENPGRGGYAAVFVENGKITKTLLGSAEYTTNNRMEMIAVLEALKELPDGSDETIVSDSQYVIHTLTKGWKRKKNQDIWLKIDRELERLNVNLVWIKGHRGNPFNEAADELASRAASEQINLKEDKQPSLFDM